MVRACSARAVEGGQVLTGWGGTLVVFGTSGMAYQKPKARILVRRLILVRRT